MSQHTETYEVEVEVFLGGKHYGYYPVHSEDAKSKAEKGVYIKDKLVKMFHFENCSYSQAIEKGKKHGKVKSCQKVDAYESLRSIEHIELNQETVYDRGNPYPNAMAMGEMLWNKKIDRRNNLINQKKDKEPID
jgi:hypothetical protein